MDSLSTTESSASCERGATARRRPAGHLRAGSMTVRLVLFAIVLVSVTAMLIGTLSYTRARRALEIEAEARLAVIARDIAEDLHAELVNRVADITTWRKLEVMRAVLYHDVDKELARLLQHLAEGRDAYRAVACFTPDGRLVAGVGTVAAIALDAPPSAPRISVTPASQRGGGLLQLAVAIPHPEDLSEVMGSLVLLLDPGPLLDTIATPVRTDGGRLTVELRDKAGGLLLETGGQLSSTRSQTTGGGAHPLTGRAAVGMLEHVASPDLEVVVDEPRALALAAVADLRGALLRTGLLALLLSSALGALVAWWIGRPIRRLTQTAREIAERGDLDLAVELPTAGGEIGVLTAAFQRMVDSLSAAHARALAQSRLAFLGEIAANVAHEVRTPLSVLKTSGQLLGRPELPAGEQRRLAAMIAAEVDRLNTVVTDLVDIARSRPAQYRSLNLAHVVRRTATFFSASAARSEVDIVQRIEDPAIRIRGNADQLHQVLLNLIGNALQAIGGHGRVELHTYREGDRAVVEVRDTGPGFALEILPKAFSPFVTTKADGTGLGLAISKRIVEEHGGTVAAENLPGRGARLSLRLPVEPPVA
jgi:two-component system, NtrC family, sensor histidine kinase HydH